MLLDLGEQRVKTKPCRRALGTATIEFMLKSFDYYNYVKDPIGVDSKL